MDELRWKDDRWVCRISYWIYAMARAVDHRRGQTQSEWNNFNVCSFIVCQKDHHRLIGFSFRAEGLQSILMIANHNDLYLRFADPSKYNLTNWSPKSALNVIKTWQRKYSKIIFNWPNNTLPPRRIVHPLAAASLEDMVDEFSQFNPWFIIIGYALMVSLIKNHMSLNTISHFHINSILILISNLIRNLINPRSQRHINPKPCCFRLSTLVFRHSVSPKRVFDLVVD